MKNLRVFVLTFCLMSSLTILVYPKTTCLVTGQKSKDCISEIDAKKFVPYFAPEDGLHWSWAASLSMIFNYDGHPVPQSQILEAIFPEAPHPSPTNAELAAKASMKWVDSKGKQFSALITPVYDSVGGNTGMTDEVMAKELHLGHPVILISGANALLCTSVKYSQGPSGTTITRIRVFDPRPGNGVRDLSLLEMIPLERGGSLTFAAITSIEEKK